MAGVKENNKFFKNKNWKDFKDPVNALDKNITNPVKLRAALVDLAK
jgi:hypothetical protein